MSTFQHFHSNDFVLLHCQMPDLMNWFGWCTWDAFYTDVTAEGVKQGLERYSMFLPIYLNFVEY